MPRSDNYKLHTLAVYLVLQKYCDDEYGLSIDEIRHKLKETYEIIVDRNTIMRDFLAIESMLHLVIEERGENPVRYYWLNRDYTLDDIQQLIISVQVNADLSPSRKVRLVDKTKNFLSEPIAKRIKIQNAVAAQIYDLSGDTEDRIEELWEHIENQTLIKFYYPRYDFGRNAVLTASPRICYAFPVEIVNINRKSVLCAYLLAEVEKEDKFEWRTLGEQHRKIENEDSQIAFFNVDLIENMQIVPQSNRLSRNRDTFPNDDVIEQGIKTARAVLFREKAEMVTIQCTAALLPIIADRFDNIMTVTELKDGFQVTAETSITPEFLGWVICLGNGAKLTAPLHATQRIKQLLKAQAKQYGV